MIGFLVNQLGKIKTFQGFIFADTFILSISWFADGLIGVIGFLLKGWFWGAIALLSVIPPVVVFWIYKNIYKKPTYETALFISALLTIALTFILPVLKLYLNWEIDSTIPIIQLFLSLGIFTSSWLYIKELDINISIKKVEPKDVKGLVMFLSYWKEIPKSLSNDLLEFKKPDDFHKHRGGPWEMQLRLIEKYSDTLKFVYVIGSNSSKEQISIFKEIVKHFFPNIEVIEHYEAIDFEELDKNIDALKKAFENLREKRLKDKQIIIDTTGGQKIQSIAGAFYSSTYDRYFAYVSTNTKDVKVFDVIMGEGER